MPGEIIFLGDFGGTHLRMALRTAKGPEQIAVYKVAEWPGIDDVLRDYAAKTATDLRGAALYLAHTGHVIDGGLTLHYKETKPWSFRLDAVRDTFDLARLEAVNDLEAAAFAVLHESVPVFEIVRPGANDARSDAVVMGLGTGIGHAYINCTTHLTRETYGGHFPATGVTGRQRALIEMMRIQKRDNQTFIAEDILSGEGLMRLYRTMAQYTNQPAQAKTVQDIIPLRDRDPLVKETASVFSEFLGLHAHMLCSVAHAYGGIYLCGGLFDRLYRAGLFDQRAFLENLHQSMVPVVDHSLRATAVFVARVEHVSLYGLDVRAARS